MTSQTSGVIWESGLVEEGAEVGAPLAEIQFQVFALVDISQCVWIVRDFTTSDVALERHFKTSKAAKAWLQTRIDAFNDRNGKVKTI